jgi:glycosyltransferase involved in cell wall biosynthesis
MQTSRSFAAAYGVLGPTFEWLGDRQRGRLLRWAFGSISSAERTALQTTIRDATSQREAFSIVFLPMVSWHIFAFQRSHQLARAFARLGHPTYFAERWKYPPELLRPGGVAARDFVGARTLEDNLHLLRVPPGELFGLIDANMFDWAAAWFPHQLHFMPKRRQTRLLYELIDDLSLMPGMPKYWRRLHERAAKEADVVAGTADDLVAQLRAIGSDVLECPNGVALEDWVRSETSAVPDDLAAARAHQAVVCYYGTLSRWFDWESWNYAAAQRPEFAFVLIGPIDAECQSNVDSSVMPKNMFYLGPKPYESLPAYMQHVDVATIPFVLSKLTHAVSPVKLFEYMAAGKPIVASRMREIEKYRSVFLADNPQQFVAQLDVALRAKSDPLYQAQLQMEARQNTWAERATRLIEAMQAKSESTSLRRT